MNLRRYLLLRAYGFVAIALFIGALPLIVKVDTAGHYFSIGFAGLCAFLAFLNFRKAGKAREEDRPFAPPTDATAPQQAAYYRKILIAGAIAFLILTVITAMDLNALQSGTKESVMLVEPVPFLYEKGGYWPAVLFFPVVGLVTCGALLSKVRSLKEGDHVES